ncbi:MAG: cyclic nucleotide-binding domain-containing protein [Sulfuricellaceae bacterium]|nr:cyclic nucleotide-binding domain-containing protein [Sulfuricellaceae bacterium]
MNLSSFFDYTGQTAAENAEDLVFLQNQSPEEWTKLLASTGVRRFHRGEMLIEQGDRVQAVYIVTRGSLEVLTPTGKHQVLQRIATIDEGSVFGEQSFFDGKPRSASIRALDDGELRSLTLEAFEVLAAHEPELARAVIFDLARILSLRLRQTTALAARLWN